MEPFEAVDEGHPDLALRDELLVALRLGDLVSGRDFHTYIPLGGELHHNSELVQFFIVESINKFDYVGMVD